MRCDECKYWSHSDFNKHVLPEDYSGICSGLHGDRVIIEVEAGWNGGCVGNIETDCDFFCANFEVQEDVEEK